MFDKHDWCESGDWVVCVDAGNCKMDERPILGKKYLVVAQESNTNIKILINGKELGFLPFRFQRSTAMKELI
jgi:hypothetical protein